MLRVMNAELLLELELDVVEEPVVAPAPPVPVPPLEPLDTLEVVEPEDDDPPPDTVVPTDPLMAETVPSAGARSVVSSSVFWALATLDWAEVTEASAAVNALRVALRGDLQADVGCVERVLRVGDRLLVGIRLGLRSVLGGHECVLRVDHRLLIGNRLGVARKFSALVIAFWSWVTLACAWFTAA